MTTTTLNKTESATLKENALALMTLIEEFGALLRQETAGLKKADYRTVDLLQEDKRSFARKYQALVTSIAAQRDQMSDLDLNLRERMVRARGNFTLILDENLRALEASRDSARRLVDRILDTARKAVADELQTHYSAGGNTQAYKSATMSLSVDQSL